MKRRIFIEALAFGLGGSILFPAKLMAQKNSFDLALEGQELLAQGKYKEAIALLTQASKMDRENEWIWGLLGRAYFQKGDMRKSLESFRQVLKINPDDTYSRMMVDIITQKPLPPKEEKPIRPLSELERKALEEEKHIFARLSDSRGLGYRIQRVVLDPGHGGFDSGAVGLNKLQEKNVNLDLAQKTARILKKLDPGLKIFLTRTDDYYVPLSARTTTANQYNADMFISFHINANKNRKPRGMETYFCAEKASSKEAARVAQFENSVLKYDKQDLVQKGYVNIEEILFLFERKRYWEAGGKAAQEIQKNLATSVSLRNRGVHSANFYVLRRAKMPSILLETGFISNPDEERLLGNEQFRYKLATSIAQAIFSLKETGL
ncbi:N-acetylmuramoyl-L-alanine amidase [Desulfovulcanus sp.]